MSRFVIQSCAATDAGPTAPRRLRILSVGCTERRKPNTARIVANVSTRGLPLRERVRYRVSRESLVFWASAVIPPTESAIVRSAIGTARASPSSSMVSMYVATWASLWRWSAALNGWLRLTGRRVKRDSRLRPL